MAFKIIHTEFRDLLVLEPRVHEDARGYFMESYNKEDFLKAGIDVNFVQDNQSSSAYGVVRGLHFQTPPFSQTKLVRVLMGAILDAVVDLRRGEPTFGKSFCIELSSQNRRQLLVPSGFAHGFAVLSSTAEVFYKCDQFYRPAFERGINYSDPHLMINWQLPPEAIQVSDKDRSLPLFKELEFSFEAV